MKKLLVLTLSVLMLVSCFAFSAMAEANVNVAQGKTYEYTKMNAAFKKGLEDNACTLLTDNEIPDSETPSKSVAFEGSNKDITVVIDLGAVYSDITAVNFCGVWDSFADKTSGGNRGFAPDQVVIAFSENGVDFKDAEGFTHERVAFGQKESMYNFNFSFDAPQTAQKVELTFRGPGYILTLGEIEVISTSGEGTIPEESSEEESSEESSEESVEESVEESAEESAEESVEESVEESIEESADESANASTNDSKDDKKDDGKDGSNGLLIVGIIVAVVVVAVVVVVLMKKKDNKQV